MHKIYQVLSKTWGFRHALIKFITEPSWQISALSQITLESLDAQNIAVVILDFDGVLAPHGQSLPDNEVMIWLKNLSMNIGEQRIAILSNKPTLAREEFFKTHFPLILFVSGVRPKPYPDGILRISHYKGVGVHRLVLVDDRLLTGMLAVCQAYSRGWYFTQPKRDYRKQPLTELFFDSLRLLERFVIKCLAKC